MTMGSELPADWYEDHDGQSRVLNADRVATELLRMWLERKAVLAKLSELESRPSGGGDEADGVMLVVEGVRSVLGANEQNTEPTK